MQYYHRLMGRRAILGERVFWPLLGVGMAIGFALVLMFLGLVVRSMLDLPEVHLTYPGKKCIKVVDRRAVHLGLDSEWSCDNLPLKYVRVWVL